MQLTLKGKCLILTSIPNIEEVVIKLSRQKHRSNCNIPKENYA